MTWLRANLFPDWFNTIVTIALLFCLWQIAVGVWHWAVDAAIWEANSRRECLTRSPEGACWAGVIRWWKPFLYGRYPHAEIWRIDLAALVLLVWTLPLMSARVAARRSIAITALLLYPVLGWYLLQGGARSPLLTGLFALSVAGFLICAAHAAACLLGWRRYRRWAASADARVGDGEYRAGIPVLAVLAVTATAAAVALGDWAPPLVPTTQWGALSLTLLIAGVTIVAALPLGAVLALGRRSTLPLIAAISTVYIELMRALPLVPVLLIATMMVPIMLPEGLHPNKLALCLAALCAFEAAYMAEIVRGGMQAVPQGQIEAARSLGMTWWQEQRLIVLPRALHMMIPNIVGSFTGLLKGTAVVSIFGLYDFTAMTRAVSQTTAWIGLFYEPMAVAFVVYFAGCYAMTWTSRHLERRLGMNERV